VNLPVDLKFYQTLLNVLKDEIFMNTKADASIPKKLSAWLKSPPFHNNEYLLFLRKFADLSIL
jgi:hypothetical protein